jgi:hypothetical protein
MEQQLITYPTWERYTILAHVISSLTIRDRRQIFQLARSTNTSFFPDLFFPNYGFTLAEFAVWYTLSDNRRKMRKKNK